VFTSLIFTTWMNTEGVRNSVTYSLVHGKSLLQPISVSTR